MPSRKGALYATKRIEAEKNLSKDLAAYKSMAMDSSDVQPKQIDGCHELMQRAETKAEVEAGIPLETKKQRDQLKTVMAGGESVAG